MHSVALGNFSVHPMHHIIYTSNFKYFIVLIFISDFNDLVKKIIDKKITGEILNVGTGKPQKIIDLAKLIGGKVQSIPTRPGEPFRSCANIKKISSHLKWKPTVPFKEGVSKMMNEIEKWKDAPLWTPKKIKKATQVWFKFMKK